MGKKFNVICFNCGTRNVVDIEPVEKITINFVCQECGALNEVSVDPLDGEQDWLCIPPRGFEWVLPSGKITPIIGDPIYVSAFGEHLSRQKYIDRYKVDPEIAYQYMRRKRSTETTSKITNNKVGSVEANPVLDLSNVKEIDVLCKNCNHICELKI